MISMGVPAGVGGVVANLENFSSPAMRAFPSRLIPLCTLNFLFLNFCYPLPPPTAKPKIPMGFFREGWGGGGGGKPNFIPAVAGGVQGMSSFGITRRSSRS